MNTFTPAQPGSSSNRSSLSAFSSVAPMKNAWSTQARPARAAQFVVQRRLVDRVGVGVRHLEKGRDPAHGGAGRAGRQVFLVLKAGLAEMDLGIDHAGQDGEAGGVETLRRSGRAKGAQGRDLPVLHPDVAGFEAVRRRHLAARQNKIEIVWHSRRR